MEDKIYWHLPGFFKHMNLYLYLIDEIEKNPGILYNGYCIGSVYGTFPGAIWNGGRFSFGLSTQPSIKEIIKSYNSMGIPIRYTFTNQLLEENHMNDTYCNMIMKNSDNGINQVIVYSPILESYLRSNYPNFKLISTTTKLIKDVDILIEELKKEYFMVVLDGDFAHSDILYNELLDYKDKVEIMANESCIPNCPLKDKHYRQLSIDQITFTNPSKFPCLIPSYEYKEKPNFPKYDVSNQFMDRLVHHVYSGPNFLNNNEINSLINAGYRNFKIVGRARSSHEVLEMIIYFLIRDEYKVSIYNKLRSVINP